MCFDRGNDGAMRVSVGDHHAFILSQRRTLSEVRGMAVDVCDFSARFLDDQNSAGVVPDLFLITFSRRQTQVLVGITACHCKIFALTVHAKRFQMNTKFGGNQP